MVSKIFVSYRDTQDNISVIIEKGFFEDIQDQIV